MPRAELPSPLWRLLKSKARLKVAIGGRSSGKSEGVARIMHSKAQTERADILCGRELQNSIDDSVHKLLSQLVDKLGIEGIEILDKKMDYIGGGGFRFKGFARNSAAVKSAQGFKYSWIEEAQDLSGQSLDDLLPTIRAMDSELWFTGNPQSSKDPFSQRFIVPFTKELERQGYYEDEMHCIVLCNWRDNPWHGELEQQRLWDYENLPRAKYDHIWEGAFNDSVDNAIIQAEWFDAAIDAHVKLGFKPRGVKMVSHDPSDSGDPRAFVYRHGSVILDVQENTADDVNDACDWATDYAVSVGADVFIWDADGLGLTLKRQVNAALGEKKMDIIMFKGSETPDKPDEVYQPDERIVKFEAKNNKETFRNKRSQYYWRLRDRFYSTYRAVVKGEYVDPDEMISISSDIECMAKFRSEVCRIPKKSSGTGFIQIMTKKEMKDRYKIDSPNLADSVMMSMEIPEIVKQHDDYRGKRRGDYRAGPGGWMT